VWNLIPLEHALFTFFFSMCFWSDLTRRESFSFLTDLWYMSSPTFKSFETGLRLVFFLQKISDHLTFMLPFRLFFLFETSSNSLKKEVTSEKFLISGKRAMQGNWSINKTNLISLPYHQIFRRKTSFNYSSKKKENSFCEF